MHGDFVITVPLSALAIKGGVVGVGGVGLLTAGCVVGTPPAKRGDCCCCCC